MYNFEPGFPTRDATQRARDDADYERAVTAYRFWYPTVSAEGICNGNREMGAKDNDSIMMMSAGPRHVLFTPNSDTPYAAAVLDVKNGPDVIRGPAGAFIGLGGEQRHGRN